MRTWSSKDTAYVEFVAHLVLFLYYCDTYFQSKPKGKDRLILDKNFYLPSESEIWYVGLLCLVF